MATTYIVQSIMDCETCNGTGWIYNKAWDNPALAAMTTTEIRRYIEDHGNEEIKCYQCSGAGEIRREVALIEALQMLEWGTQKSATATSYEKCSSSSRT